MVLRDFCTEERIMRFAEEAGLEMVKDESSDEPMGVVRDVAWRVIPGLILQYVRDSRSGCSILSVGGRPPESAERIERSVEENFKPWGLSELVTEARSCQEKGDRMRAVLRAGVGAPAGFDRSFYEVIENAISDEDPEIRWAGLWATSYSRWGEFRELVKNVMENDPEEVLRSQAGVILQGIDGDREAG
ncbi:hypothetical protein C0036_04480 [Streptomyces sp. DJ]|nr:hypothetical protein C0036_04480 [Streptomyces sp. DJ]